MIRERLQREIFGRYVEYFGLDAATVARPGTSIVSRPRYGKWLLAMTLGTHTVVEYGEEAEAEAGALASTERGLPLAELPELVPGEEQWGYVLHCAPERLRRPAPQAGELRRLTEADAEAFRTLEAACTEADRDEALIGLDDEVVFGVWQGDRLAGMASGYRRNGFFDPGVLTHPNHRRQGVGAATVAAVLHYGLEQGFWPQYRCVESHEASRRVAESIGLEVWFETMAVEFSG